MRSYQFSAARAWKRNWRYTTGFYSKRRWQTETGLLAAMRLFAKVSVLPSWAFPWMRVEAESLAADSPVSWVKERGPGRIFLPSREVGHARAWIARVRRLARKLAAVTHPRNWRRKNDLGNDPRYCYNRTEKSSQSSSGDLYALHRQRIGAALAQFGPVLGLSPA